MNITAPFLRSLDIYVPDRDAFAAAFPDGLLVTGEPDADAIARIVKADLDVGRLCARVLTAVALAEYERARDAAWAEYGRVEAATYAEHQRVHSSPGAEYERAMAQAWTEYERARVTAAWRFIADDENIKSEYRGRP